MTVWDEDKVAEFRKLWDEGLSASQIAPVLGVTRNAVCGAARRLKLPSRISPIAPKKTQQKAKPVLKAKKIVPPKDRRAFNGGMVQKMNALREEPVLPSNSRFLRSDVWNPQPGQVLLPLEKLTENTCRWPLSDPVAGFCGQQTATDKRGRQRSYCPHHHNRSIDRRIETK